MPAILHWGRDLGVVSPRQLAALADAVIPATAHSAPDGPLQLSVFPLLNQAWQGRPALEGSPSVAPFRLEDVRHDESSARVSLVADPLRVVIDYELSVEGLLKARATLTNVEGGSFRVNELSLVIPLPGQAVEVLDFGGRWAAERRPQRHAIAEGTWLRESRHGRGGHDAAYVLAAGTPGFSFRSGEVWALHLGWGGNQRLWIEHQSSGITAAGAGEVLAPEEVILDGGESYSTPWLYGSWSDRGLDGISQRFHAFIRRTTGSDRRAHPVILNTWEAVYFDHDDNELRRLATLAAELGVELFVLDDGWMSGRLDDTRGLGDWTVDLTRRPAGLSPLIQHVNDLGMDFGLWVEPEMATLNSEVLRAHPEWILTDSPGVIPVTARNQLAIDLTIPEAFEHVVGQLDALLTEYPIRYLKWDHNRDLLVRALHEQTLATYRLMSEIALRHPNVSIEGCASGGGRIDLRTLESVVRVWPSDNNDSLARQSIYRWTTLLIPPELFGAHVGAPTSHLTGRTHSLSYRLATALFGWAGIEWDLRDASQDELGTLSDWIGKYKALRGLLHTGVMIRADRDDALWVHGIVAPDSSEAVFSISAVDMTADAVPASLRLPGLDPDRSYLIEPLMFGEPPRYTAAFVPPWLGEEGVIVLGRLLAEVGVAAPALAPEQTLVLRLMATD